MCTHLMIRAIGYDDDAMQTTVQPELEIRADDSDLDNGDIDILCKAIRVNQQYLVSINLEKNALEAYGVSALCNHLAVNNIYLRSLNLASNLLGASSMPCVGKYAQFSLKLKTLNLSHNTIRSKGIRSFIQYVYNHPSLSCLNVNENRIDLAAAIDLIGVSQTCNEVSELHMESNLCDVDKMLVLKISDILNVKYVLKV